MASVLKTCAALLVVAIAVPAVAFITAYAVTKVPEPEELVNNQISTIVADDGTSEIARIVPPEGNRQNVKLSEVPAPVRNAVLAAEDRDFYKNPGFSVTGFGRAVLGQLTGKDDAGGGSTITQQYVKNALVGDERSVTRKAKELVISSKMAREWTKDEILEAYLNTIYFGRSAYGISAASKAYFNKPVEELTAEEGAVLAASIQAPSALDPWINRENAERRWNYVLDGMESSGWMSSADRAAAKYPEVVDPATVQTQSVANGANGLIKSQVIAELTAAGITEDQVNTGGLKITTTIDPALQQQAVDTIHNNLNYNEDIRGALVSIDPKTGAVKAYYGGDDPVGWDYAGSGLQTGSTFKIMGLAAYLDQGGSLSDLFDSSPVTTDGTTVNNVGGESCGTCSIAQALKMSLNTSFIRLVRDLRGGAQDVADMAHRLGVATEFPGMDKTLTENGGAPYEGIVLGMYQSRVLDMASALATLSNEGAYNRPHFVQKVENSDGEVLLDNSPAQPEQVVSEDVANDVVSAMQPIAAYSNGKSLAGGRPSAAKTGTTQLGDTGENKDAWMIGSTPQLATAVWVGSNNNTPLRNAYGGTMYGAGVPADIWKTFMDSALANQPVEQFSGSTSYNSYGGGSSSGTSYGTNDSYSSNSNTGDTTSQPVEEAPAPAPAPAEPAPNAPDPGEAVGNISDFVNGLLNP
ncbi:penicillin-binding protein [Corynebacterium sp. 320]|uniref:transglycosylase domain-containing protein n=1 Tax=Corynebacterium TaxID=1716 RepID=UPI00125CBE29|nr:MULTISPECIES: transglycosylase domain-containing protein [Corynebacterium]KAB1502912.1 penicillin-binding protein [Corynebacterium sp. 320]KAB1550569.1 penicillin-binding protein [Corynebacterium sp. 319]KAB1554856.1 penicillin-binding protein [Corynebacterium sp. 321]KAB3526575.1 penicillin-binding protein [Corynebacterium sp. 250]KAB3540808.1 penicillin-binding protein [Corynebacterium sp. 366]